MDSKHIKGCLNLLRFFKSKPKEEYFYQSDCKCVLVEFDKNPVAARGRGKVPLEHYGCWYKLRQPALGASS